MILEQSNHLYTPKNSVQVHRIMIVNKIFLFVEKYGYDIMTISRNLEIQFFPEEIIK